MGSFDSSNVLFLRLQTLNELKTFIVVWWHLVKSTTNTWINVSNDFYSYLDLPKCWELADSQLWSLTRHSSSNNKWWCKSGQCAAGPSSAPKWNYECWWLLFFFFTRPLVKFSRGRHSVGDASFILEPGWHLCMAKIRPLQDIASYCFSFWKVYFPTILGPSCALMDGCWRTVGGGTLHVKLKGIDAVVV